MCVCVCVCVCVSVWPSPIVEPKPTTDLVQIQYLVSSCKYLELFFNFPPNPKIKGSSHEKKIKYFGFLNNGSNDFYEILWVYYRFEAQQYGIIGFSRKNPC